MKKINYAENRNVYMPTKKMKKTLLEAYKYIYEYPDYKNIVVNNSIAKYFGVNSKNLTVTNGSLEGINLLVNCLQRKTATLFQPTFWGYEDAVKRYNYKIINYHLDQNINYNFKKLCIISKESDVMFLCIPNNPTLSSLTKQQLLQLIHESKNCHFIIDETMLIFDKDFKNKTLIKEVEHNENLSVVISFSKFLGIAGLRTGCVFSNEKMIKKIKKTGVPYSLGMIQQKILPIALSDAKYLDKTRSLIEIERNFLCKSFEQIGCKVINGNTNFILIKFSDEIDSNVITSLLMEDNLIVRNIKESYPLLEGNWLRISLQTKQNNRLLLKKIKKIVKENSK